VGPEREGTWRSSGVGDGRAIGCLEVSPRGIFDSSRGADVLFRLFCMGFQSVAGDGILVSEENHETFMCRSHLVSQPFFRASAELATSPPHRKRPNKMDQDWKPGTCASPPAAAGVPARLRSSSAAVSVSRPRVTRPQDD